MQVGVNDSNNDNESMIVWSYHYMIVWLSYYSMIQIYNTSRVTIIVINVMLTLLLAKDNYSNT